MGGILVIQEKYGKVIIRFEQFEECVNMIDVFGVWFDFIFVPSVLSQTHAFGMKETNFQRRGADLQRRKFKYSVGRQNVLTNSVDDNILHYVGWFKKSQ